MLPLIQSSPAPFRISRPKRLQGSNEKRHQTIVVIGTGSIAKSGKTHNNVRASFLTSNNPSSICPLKASTIKISNIIIVYHGVARCIKCTAQHMHPIGVYFIFVKSLLTYSSSNRGHRNPFRVAWCSVVTPSKVCTSTNLSASTFFPGRHPFLFLSRGKGLTSAR